MGSDTKMTSSAVEAAHRDAPTANSATTGTTQTTNNTVELEQRMTELESRLAFQDDALQALDDVLVTQQREVERREVATEERGRLADAPIERRFEDPPLRCVPVDLVEDREIERGRVNGRVPQHRQRRVHDGPGDRETGRDAALVAHEDSTHPRPS